ncbi:copper-binding protein [Rhodoligotrophos ferricapiens]|uniref:copper-binding protein n=1 Tax=Rhodoligotrophos ferricapiens TaxID=3069264 RepID=UPI00315C7433
MKTILSALMLTLMSSIALAQGAQVNGEVKKIDTSAGKITLRHDPIPNLEMDSMTMVFRVKDPQMLKSVKVGQKVKFEAARVNGALTVVSIQGSK